MLVLCDLDNTVLDRCAAFDRWAASFVVVHRIADSAASAWLREADADGYLDRFAFFTQARARYDLEPDVDELLEAYRADYPSHYRCDDETRQALARLRDAGAALALVTNGESRTQRLKLDHAGIADCFDAVCVSDDIGFYKPHARPFALAAYRARRRLRDSGWMIGDHPRSDIVGARALGLRTVWMRRDRSWAEPAWRPDIEADTFAAGADAILAQYS